MPEFGAFVHPKPPRKRSIRAGGRERLHIRPQGKLVGHLAEHTAAVTCLATSPDHLFFVSGSEDGTTRVWDSIRLERNVTSRSRQVIGQGGKITCISMLENSHCFATASTNGSLWISRVDVQLQPGSMPKYGKQAVIRQHVVNDTDHDYITCMLHYDTGTLPSTPHAFLSLIIAGRCAIKACLRYSTVRNRHSGSAVASCSTKVAKSSPFWTSVLHLSRSQACLACRRHTQRQSVALGPTLWAFAQNLESWTSERAGKGRHLLPSA